VCTSPRPSRPSWHPRYGDNCDEAGARGRGGGHGLKRGVRGIEAAGAGEEAEQRGVGERGHFGSIVTIVILVEVLLA
jgi:hypothetical protein